MTITSAWQGELAARSFTFGRGTNYPGIGGIVGAYGTPTPDADDLRLAGRDGMSGGLDRYPKRVLRIPMQVLGDGGAGVDTNLAALKAAWRRSDSDLALSLRLAGASTLTYFGRPRGIDDSRLGKVEAGTALVVATFDCLDPLAYGDLVTVTADSSSPIPLTNSGNATSYRCVLTVAGNGGTPVLTNPDDPDGDDITFTAALAGGSSYVIDLADMSVTKASVHREQDVASSSQWFGLAPGANNITFTGCASVAAEFRPAWE